MVTQVRARHEGAQFDSDVFAIADGTLPAQVQEAAEITTTRVEPGGLRAAAAGRAWCAGPQGDERDRRAVLRPDGARGSRSGSAATARRCSSTPTSSTAAAARTCRISGISGVATKTSFATFLLYSVFRSGRARRRRRDANTRALIFNVKGEDLLFLDHPNTRLDEPTTRGVRASSGWPPGRSPTCGSTPRRGPATRPARPT